VTLPLIAPVIGLSGLLVSIISFQELILAIFLCTPETETLPKVIWPNLRFALTPVVAAASGISLVATLTLIGGCWGLFRIAAGRIRGTRLPG
jgi:ABC-type spermidine/putrescine transport system permease subunit II